MTDRTYQFIYSGPLLFKTKINNKDLVKIYKYCNKKSVILFIVVVFKVPLVRFGL